MVLSKKKKKSFLSRKKKSWVDRSIGFIVLRQKNKKQTKNWEQNSTNFHKTVKMCSVLFSLEAGVFGQPAVENLAHFPGWNSRLNEGLWLCQFSSWEGGSPPNLMAVQFPLPIKWKSHLPFHRVMRIKWGLNEEKHFFKCLKPWN